MPNENILLQPHEFIVPQNAAQIVRNCVIHAIGRLPQMFPDNNGNCFKFQSYMEMKAAEDIVRKVFAREIKNREGFWAEWDLS